MEMTKTYTPRLSDPKDKPVQRWHVVDADGVTLGRLSSVVAQLLLGKHKPTFTPHLDMGDFVIVVNADRAVLTGRKEQQKVYYRHSGRPGGLKSETAAELRQRRPERMIELAVRGMLPKTRLGRRQGKKLKVYTGADHPHQAQQPERFDLEQAL